MWILKRKQHFALLPIPLHSVPNFGAFVEEFFDIGLKILDHLHIQSGFYVDVDLMGDWHWL